MIFCDLAEISCFLLQNCVIFIKNKKSWNPGIPFPEIKKYIETFSKQIKNYIKGSFNRQKGLYILVSIKRCSSEKPIENKDLKKVGKNLLKLSHYLPINCQSKIYQFDPLLAVGSYVYTICIW